MKKILLVILVILCWATTSAAWDKLYTYLIYGDIKCQVVIQNYEDVDYGKDVSLMQELNPTDEFGLVQYSTSPRDHQNSEICSSLKKQWKEKMK